MGCDLFVSPTGFYKKSFNPRTHVGCDREWLFDFAIPEVFQSTHPRGVRLRSCMRKNLQTSFNPRTHMGCDYVVVRYCTVGFCFNPRTHMGCDTLSRCRCLPRPCFNPRTHMGCDKTYLVRFRRRAVSIHAPTWGATSASSYLVAWS